MSTSISPAATSPVSASHPSPARGLAAALAAALQRDRAAVAWLLAFAALGAALVFLYPDSYQADGGYHFIFSRWAFSRPEIFLDVWGRPLFTLLYAAPAQLGYPVAKLVTVLIASATAWHGYRLACELGVPRPALAVPLLWLQPAFMLLAPETMTEPLFALVLVLALRLHVAGRVRWAMVAASLLPLARPEGFFVCLLWGAIVLGDRRAGAGVLRRMLSTAWLLSGTFLWWAAALLPRPHDPLYIVHVWPKGWGAEAATNGTGPWWHYLAIRDQILAGPIFQALFVVGLAAAAAGWLRRRAVLPFAVVAPAVLVAALHGVFFVFGLFGSAGYARYLVCAAPSFALVTLVGWNVAAGWLARAPRALAAGLATAALAAALLHCVLGVDRYGSSRDALAVRETWAWFQAHPRPVSAMVFSQPYMAILADRNPREKPPFTDDVEGNVRMLRAMPPGALAFWDARTGPLFYKLGPPELERAGFERLYSARYDLGPRIPSQKLMALRWLVPFAAWPMGHRQELFLYYKR